MPRWPCTLAPTQLQYQVDFKEILQTKYSFGRDWRFYVRLWEIVSLRALFLRPIPMNGVVSEPCSELRIGLLRPLK
jgi:hypothetical protein